MFKLFMLIWGWIIISWFIPNETGFFLSFSAVFMWWYALYHE